MVEIGGRPLLWHLMHIYSHFGFDEFVIALGYKHEVIKEYFRSFYEHNNDLTVDLANGTLTVRERQAERWRIHLIDTGLHTKTGGRIEMLRDHIGNERFMCTYGDGLASVDILALVDAHTHSGKLATLTAVRPPARFGALELDGDLITSFEEKPQMSEGWVNGGFFVFEPEIFDYIRGDEMLEHGALPRLSEIRELNCYRHGGFWQPMDTLRDKRLLEELWANGTAPWALKDISPPRRP
jgi:glucose-1-phosphate cytidylyltransferase